MSDKHLSTQFDAELSGISTRVLEMGGLVESQVAQAVYALTHFSSEIAAQVLAKEERVNAMEVEIDRDLSTHHRPAPAHRARPAPADRHLQDDRQSRARRRRGGAHRAHGPAADEFRRVESRLRLPVNDLAYESELAIAQLRKALDAFARLDVERRSRCSSRTTRSTRSSKA